MFHNDTMGPFHERYFHCNSDSMEISFCSYPSCKEMIAMKFCTWHDSFADMACAKFCNNICYKALCSKNNFPLNLNDNGKIVCEMGAWLLTILYIPFVAKIKLQTHKRHISTLYSWYCNMPISQIPQCTRQIFHNGPFCNRNVHTCAHFCYKMVHFGIWDWCIVGFVQQVYRDMGCGLWVWSLLCI